MYTYASDQAVSDANENLRESLMNLGVTALTNPGPSIALGLVAAGFAVAVGVFSAWVAKR